MRLGLKLLLGAAIAYTLFNKIIAEREAALRVAKQLRLAWDLRRANRAALRLIQSWHERGQPVKEMPALITQIEMIFQHLKDEPTP